MNLVVPTIVVEPHHLFREGLHRILLDAHFQIFWSHDVPPEGPIDGLSAEQSPLVVLGSRDQDVTGHVCQLKREFPRACIALMFEPEWHQEILTALQQSVSAFIPRNCSYPTFINTLKLAFEGTAGVPEWLIRSVLTDSQEPIPENENGGPITQAGKTIAEVVASPPPPDAPPPTCLGVLSPRELDVLRCLREGRSNKEIAQNLGITEWTVRAHVRAILRKMRVRNRTQAATWSSKFSI